MKKVIPDSWAIPDSVRVRVGATIGRQRLVLEEGHALLLLHQPPAPGVRDRAAAMFWRSPDASWRSLPVRSGLPALREHLEQYESRITELDARRAAATTALAQGEVLVAARPVERAARHMHAALQSMREAVPDDQDVLAARDRAYELARTAELLVEDAEAALELSAAQRAEEQALTSERIATESRRLNLLAAVCLPITALGAVLSMNLPSGLDGWVGPSGYWTVVGAAVATGLAVNLWIQRLPPRTPPIVASSPRVRSRA